MKRIAGVSRVTPIIGALIPVLRIRCVAPFSIVLRNSVGGIVDSGSGSNRSNHKRRFYINGYVRAGDCDRGEWAFRGGRAVPLGPIPALVHYEELRERPEPHYV